MEHDFIFPSERTLQVMYVNGYNLYFADFRTSANNFYNINNPMTYNLLGTNYWQYMKVLKSDYAKFLGKLGMFFYG